LPEGTVALTLVFKETSSVASTAPVSDCLTFFVVDCEHLTLSLDEFTILGLKIIVVQGLLSFHHFENLGHRLWQDLEQQQ